LLVSDANGSTEGKELLRNFWERIYHDGKMKFNFYETHVRFSDC